MEIASKTPLTQALPWFFQSNKQPKQFILVTDSVETNGRFLLYSQATHTLLCSQQQKEERINTEGNSSVLWLSCGPLTEFLVASSLRKMGCEAATDYLKRVKNGTNITNGPLAILSIMSDIVNQEDPPDLDESYLKKLYYKIKDRRDSSRGYDDKDSSSMLVVVDDASALANIFGERLTYLFLSYIRALSSVNMIVRCSNDIDKDSFMEHDLPSVHPTRKADWFGAGGQRNNLQQSMELPWERTLVELADWVADITPLSSGYSREAHGRIIVSAVPSCDPPLVMNYSLQDNSVFAIRLKASLQTKSNS